MPDLETSVDLCFSFPISLQVGNQTSEGSLIKHDAGNQAGPDLLGLLVVVGGA